MPDLDGASAAPALLQRHAGLGVVVLTMHADTAEVVGVVLERPASGARNRQIAAALGIADKTVTSRARGISGRPSASG